MNQELTIDRPLRDGEHRVARCVALAVKGAA